MVTGVEYSSIQQRDDAPRRVTPGNLRAAIATITQDGFRIEQPLREVPFAAGRVEAVILPRDVRVGVFALTGVAPFRAVVPSFPGLQIEARLMGRSEAHEIGGTGQLSLGAGLICVSGAGKGGLWRVAGAAQSELREVSINFPARFVEALSSIEPELAARAVALIAGAPAALRSMTAEERAVAEAIAATDPRRAGGMLDIEGAALRLLSLVLRAETGRARPRAEGVAERAAALIEAGCTDSLSVAALASRLGVSTATLRRAMARTYGRSPMQVAAERRHALARRLLEEGRLRIQEIAERLGYRSAENFASAFRRVEGCAPREWRARRSETDRLA